MIRVTKFQIEKKEVGEIVNKERKFFENF
jgi:hypothetical protein